MSYIASAQVLLAAEQCTQVLVSSTRRRCEFISNVRHFTVRPHTDIVYVGYCRLSRPDVSSQLKMSHSPLLTSRSFFACRLYTCTFSIPSPLCPSSTKGGCHAVSERRILIPGLIVSEQSRRFVSMADILS